MKAMLFNGSPRKDGNTAQALALFESILQENHVDTEILRIGGTGLRGCIACYKCLEKKDHRCHGIKDDPLNEYLEKMKAADGIVIGSPTYFGNISADVKALIDRCGFLSRVNGFMLQRKVGAAISVARRAGAIHALTSIHHFFLINDMMLPGSTYWGLCLGLKPGDIQNDSEGLESIKRMAANTAWMIHKLRG